jgi:hypothetical protein
VNAVSGSCRTASGGRVPLGPPAGAMTDAAPGWWRCHVSPRRQMGEGRRAVGHRNCFRIWVRGIHPLGGPERAFRARSKKLHPDLGGDPAAFRALLGGRSPTATERTRRLRGALLAQAVVKGMCLYRRERP